MMQVGDVRHCMFCHEDLRNVDEHGHFSLGDGSHYEMHLANGHTHTPCSRDKEVCIKWIQPKFRVGEKAYKPKGYKFPCTIVAVFKNLNGDYRVVAEMDEYGLMHIFNEEQLEHYGNDTTEKGS